MPVKPNSINK
jgi:hypothetical protein